LKRDTRCCAKRQLSWFRADPEIKWYEPEQAAAIIEATGRFLEEMKYETAEYIPLHNTCLYLRLVVIGRTVYVGR